MKQYVIGIDPGLITGVCVVNTERPRVIESAELDFRDYSIWLDSALTIYPREHLVVCIERFTINANTHKNGQAPWSLEGIGAARSALFRKYGSDDLLRMSAQNAKTFSTNPKLKAVDLWHVGGAGHANDALRHALHYMVDVGWSDKRLLKK